MDVTRHDGKSIPYIFPGFIDAHNLVACNFLPKWTAETLRASGALAVVQAVRPTGCDPVLVQGATKRLCKPVFSLVETLGKQFPYLVPVIR